MNGATGSLSNPSEVMGVCPDGWHLPSDAEWKELEMFLGISQEGMDIPLVVIEVIDHGPGQLNFASSKALWF